MSKLHGEQNINIWSHCLTLQLYGLSPLLHLNTNLLDSASWMLAEDMRFLGEKPRTVLLVTQKAAWISCLYHFTFTPIYYECDVEASGRRCTRIRGSWAQLKSLELRETEFFIENRKPIWLLLQRRHDLYYSAQKTRLPFVPDTISSESVCCANMLDEIVWNKGNQWLCL